MNTYHPEGWPGVDVSRVKVRRLHRNLIAMLLDDVLHESASRGGSFNDLGAVRDSEQPVPEFSSEARDQVDVLRTFLYEKVYKSPLVSRQNSKADHVLEQLFVALTGNSRLLPRYVQQRLKGSPSAGSVKREVAFFLASLTDRAAIDLYAELFVPSDRAMSHHVR